MGNNTLKMKNKEKYNNSTENIYLLENNYLIVQRT